jgi:Leucine Rich repeat
MTASIEVTPVPEPASVEVSGDDAVCLYTKPQLLRLLRARDDMLAAKAKEVGIVGHHNETLRERLDAAEAELGEMQTMIEAKDKALLAQKREAERGTRAVKRLQLELEQHAGRETAIEVTATQSTRLLKLLEQEELKREALLCEKDAAQSETRELRARLRTVDARAAEQSSELQSRLSAALTESATLRQHYAGVEQRLVAQAAAIAAAEHVAAEQSSQAQEELLRHKAQQYTTLQQLQQAEDALAKQQDSSEGRADMLTGLTQQSAALELLLAQTRTALQEAQAAARESEIRAQEDRSLAAARCESDRTAKKALQERVRSASKTIAALVDKHEQLEAVAEQRLQDTVGLEARLQAAAQRIVRLERAVTQLQSGASIEKTQKRLHRALDQFNKQAGGDVATDVTSVTATAGSLNSVSSGSGSGRCVCRCADAVAHSGGLASTAWPALQHQTWSKRKIMMRCVTAAAAVASDNSSVCLPSTSSLDNSATVDSVDDDCNDEYDEDNAVDCSDIAAQQQQQQHVSLDSCGISDLDIACMVAALLQGPERHSLCYLGTLDLRGNLITDAAIEHLCSLIAAPNCRLQRLDLRYNSISLEGVRALARALEASTHQRCIKSVCVHKEGRIDAIGLKPDSSSGSTKSSNAADAFMSVIVIDARDNVASSSATALSASSISTASTVSPTKRCSSNSTVKYSNSGSIKTGATASSCVNSVSKQSVAGQQQRAIRDAVVSGAYSGGYASFSIASSNSYSSSNQAQRSSTQLPVLQ